MNEVGSIVEYLAKIEEINAYFDENDIKVYRGENRIFETPCYPNLFRGDYLKKNPYFEKNILDEINANDLEQKNNYLLKAINAQHGGFPSRLLDVTYNSLIALYFAITPFYTQNEDIDDNEDGVVYIIDIEESYCALNSDIEKVYNSIVNRDNIYFQSKLCEYNHKFIDHVKTNERIVAQQGAVILFQGDNFTPLPKYSYEKIIIKKESKQILRKQLKKLFGISTEYIYPEISNKICSIVDKSIRYISYTFSIENELELLKNYFDNYMEYELENLKKVNGKYNIEDVIRLEREIMQYKLAIEDIIDRKDQFIDTDSEENMKHLLCSAYHDAVINFQKVINKINKNIKISDSELRIMDRNIDVLKGDEQKNGKNKEII